jgi:UDP:flavonoid glycosyltransferase YjiC (YdhE family)
VPRVGIVAGPDAGHAFPAFALAELFAGAGYGVVVYTGKRWLKQAARSGIPALELPGLTALADDDDGDAGDKLSGRAARIARALEPSLISEGVDLVTSDVITLGGGWAAELAGVPWVECSPHPLYDASRGLPPVGSGLAVGTGPRGRLRDSLMRAATGRSIRLGERQRAAARTAIGLPPGPCPAARLVATLPALEVRRPDWPARTHIVRPLLWEPTNDVFDIPPGDGPLIMVAPSTAATGADDMVSTVLGGLGALRRDIRVVVSGLDLDDATIAAICTRAGLPTGSVVTGLARQDRLLASGEVATVICGSGHGILAKSLSHGVPVVTIPGGGDQWELANRVSRLGAGTLVRPVTEPAVTAAVRTVLDDRAHTAAAARIAASATGLVTPVQVVDRILRRGADTARMGSTPCE